MDKGNGPHGNLRKPFSVIIACVFRKNIGSNEIKRHAGHMGRAGAERAEVMEPPLWTLGSTVPSCLGCSLDQSASKPVEAGMVAWEGTGLNSHPPGSWVQFCCLFLMGPRTGACTPLSLPLSIRALGLSYCLLLLLRTCPSSVALWTGNWGALWMRMGTLFQMPGEGPRATPLIECFVCTHPHLPSQHTPLTCTAIT